MGDGKAHRAVAGTADRLGGLVVRTHRDIGVNHGRIGGDPGRGGKLAADVLLASIEMEAQVRIAALGDFRPGDDHGRATIAAHDIKRSEEHTSELQSLMRISYAVFCMKKKKQKK